MNIPILAPGSQYGLGHPNTAWDIPVQPGTSQYGLWQPWILCKWCNGSTGVCSPSLQDCECGPADVHQRGSDHSARKSSTCSDFFRSRCCAFSFSSIILSMISSSIKPGGRVVSTLLLLTKLVWLDWLVHRSAILIRCAWWCQTGEWCLDWTRWGMWVNGHSISVHVHVCTCYMHVPAWWANVCVCVCVCMRACVHVCVCVCVNVCVNVCG